MGNFNLYAKLAKYSLVASWGVFAVSVSILIIFHNFGIAGTLKSSASMLCFALGIPLLVTIQYFYDAVDKVSRQYQVTVCNDVRTRIAPLWKHLHNEVQVGYYLSDDANAFAISSVFGDKALIAFSSGLLETADDQQLMSIAAHEIAHLKNGDSKNKAYILAFGHAVRVYPHILAELSKRVLRNFAIALAVMTAFVVLLVIAFPEAGDALNGLLQALKTFLPILAWPVGVILTYFTLNHFLDRAFCAYSREREYVADSDGATMTSRQDMIAALSLLAENKAGIIGVFDTHPPLEERRRRLQKQ